MHIGGTARLPGMVRHLLQAAQHHLLEDLWLQVVDREFQRPRAIAEDASRASSVVRPSRPTRIRRIWRCEVARNRPQSAREAAPVLPGVPGRG